jgi:hypothetical protein
MFVWLSQVQRIGARLRSSVETLWQTFPAATFVIPTHPALLAHRVGAISNGTCSRMDQSLSYIRLREGGMAADRVREAYANVKRLNRAR